MDRQGVMIQGSRDVSRRDIGIGYAKRGGADLPLRSISRVSKGNACYQRTLIRAMARRKPTLQETAKYKIVESEQISSSFAAISDQQG